MHSIRNDVQVTGHTDDEKRNSGFVVGAASGHHVFVQTQSETLWPHGIRKPATGDGSGFSVGRDDQSAGAGSTLMVGTLMVFSSILTSTSGTFTSASSVPTVTLPVLTS